jgi:hypothetical protein
MEHPGWGQSPRLGRRIRFAAVAAGVLAFALFATACDSGSSNSSAKSPSKKSKVTTTTGATANNASVTAEGAEAAIVKYLDSQGLQYAGDCATASLPKDKGKWCSTLLSGDDTSSTRTYGIGPVGEKPQKVITVTRKGSAQLTPGVQVGVADGNVGQPQKLTPEQIAGDTFITGNLVLDQAAGIGNGLADLPGGSTGTGSGTGSGTGTGTGTGGGTVVVEPGGSQYPPDGNIVVENPTVVVGGETVFQGSGCGANETLQVLFDGTPIGTVQSDATGRFAGGITIPPGTAPGVHTVTVRGAVCVLNLSVTVGGNLAFTGSSSHTGTYVLGAAAAIVLGLVLIVATRRRRRGIHGRQFPPHSAA